MSVACAGAVIAGLAVAQFSPWAGRATSTGTTVVASSPASPPGTGEVSTASGSPAYYSGIVGLAGITAWDLSDAGLSVSEDGGRTWSDVALPAGVAARALTSPGSGTVVSAAANRAVWLAAKEGDGYRVYRKRGSAAEWTSKLLVPTWTSQTGVTGPPESILVTPGPGDLLTVAEYSGTGTAGAVTDLFVSADDGSSYTEHPPLAGSGAWEYWRSVTFANPRSGVVVMGAATADVSTIVYTDDGGSTWTASSVAGLPAAGFSGFGIPTLDGPDIVVPVTTWPNSANGPANAELRLLVSDDAGRSFSAVGSAVPLESIFTATSGTIASTTWVLSGNRGPIYETQDRGSSWSTIQPVGLPAGITQIDLVSPTKATVLTTESGCSGFKTDCWTHARLWATTDAGRTWSFVG